LDKEYNGQGVSGGEDQMTERLIISGFGGQGIMFLGKLIAWAAMRENKFVSFMPAYGAEVRGGTSHCAIVISDKEIASVAFDEIDTLIAMNSPSVIKFIPKLKKGSELFINASMVSRAPLGAIKGGAGLAPKIKGVKVHLLKFTDIASGLGNVRTANMVALGAYLSSKKILSLKNILKLLPEAFKNNKKLQALNEQAIKTGMNLTK
jgi:2-oxoglutarate ferredoxin oxidoreductase subunit gamma